MGAKYNKGEWSELYAFARLLKEGRMYAADAKVNRIDDIYFPILKIIRAECEDKQLEYKPGQIIRIYKDGSLLEEVSVEKVAENAELLFEKIFEGGKEKGAFEINEMDEFLETMHINKIKASSSEKADMTMQIHDIYTGYNPVVGFSVKSDVGSPPTLLNAGKNTRIVYEIKGITDADVEEINSIDKNKCKEYMIERMSVLKKKCDDIVYSHFKNEVFEDNLVLIDTALPAIFGEMVLLHYKIIENGTYDCELLVDLLAMYNPLNYRKKNVYRYKFKKMITAAALGMTPGKEWDGYEVATGGYIIIKKDGDVLCYHLYNRDYFEEYLMQNTQFDRPSATKHDYGYIYKKDGKYYIDLNIQVRFKSIKSASELYSEKWNAKADMVREYAEVVYNSKPTKSI